MDRSISHRPFPGPCGLLVILSCDQLSKSVPYRNALRALAAPPTTTDQPPPLAVLVRLQRERPDLLKAFDVYIDGGISRGTDVLKAVCLGAKGVLIGRTPMYAMACYGEAGVKRALQSKWWQTGTSLA